MKKFFILGLILLLTLNACHFPNRYRLARTNKKKDFQSLFKSDSILMPDTNAIYLCSEFNEVSKDSEFIFVRYFGNGRVYTSRVFYGAPPTEKDYNELTTDGPDYLIKGQKHYYDITKDGLLRHEYFVNGYDGYHFIYSKVYPDSIVDILRKPRGIFTNSTRIHGVCIRKKVKLTNFNVDW